MSEANLIPSKEVIRGEGLAIHGLEAKERSLMWDRTPTVTRPSGISEALVASQECLSAMLLRSNPRCYKEWRIWR